MKSPCPSTPQCVAIGLVLSLMAVPNRPLDAALTLQPDDALVATGPATGDLTVTGNLSVVKGMDIGEAASNSLLPAVQINYFGGSEKAAKFDLTDPSVTLRWRDNLAATARDKMMLDGSNLLTLYKSDGTGAGITLNPNTGQLQLPGTGSGITAGGNPVFSVGANGNLVFGKQPVSLACTTPASASGSGALTLAGGMSAAMDSFINGIRVGRGGGNVSTNTAAGCEALAANTTGIYNTANGYHALWVNTTGGGNTAAGANTLLSNTSASCNTAIGMYAMRSNTIGSYNTATGTNALSSNISGTYNHATGYNTLVSNTTGSSNSATGSYALYFNTTGASNVAVGFNAGRYQANGSSGLSTPNNSIYIGANARGFSNLDQNAIVLGCGAIGEGANITVIGNANTLKTHLFGDLVANTATLGGYPALTTKSGLNAVLATGATLAIGDRSQATQQGAWAIGTGAQARGLGAIALGGMNWTTGNSTSNTSLGHQSITLGGVGNQALGFASVAMGCQTIAAASHAMAIGSLNRGHGSSADTWEETDPLFELGNGHADGSMIPADDPTRSNAITTLKNGQTTLTNKEWMSNLSDPLADPPSADDSGGEALVVEGHTRLCGKVIIEQTQGDISMGIYGP